MSTSRLDIQTGDHVRTIPFKKNQRAKNGVVLSIVSHNPSDPIEDHGFIEVRMDSGEVEHWAHYQWEKSMRILQGKRLLPD